MIFNIIKYINDDQNLNYDLIVLLITGIIIYLILYFILKDIVRTSNLLYLFFIDFIASLVKNRIDKYNKLPVLNNINKMPVINEEIKEPIKEPVIIKSNKSPKKQKKDTQKAKKSVICDDTKLKESKNPEINDDDSNDTIPLYNKSIETNDTINIPDYKKNI